MWPGGLGLALTLPPVPRWLGGRAWAPSATLTLFFLPPSCQKKDVDTWFKELDVNQDKAINFEEFLVLVVKVGIAAHEDIHKE